MFDLMIRDKQFPEFLQSELVGKVFRCLHPFTEEEIIELTEFYRALWLIEQNYKSKQEVRLELIKTFIEIKKQKITIEKSVLQEQIKKLESL